MKKPFLLTILALTATACLQNRTSGPKRNPYGLDIINTMEAYRESVAENPDNRLVDLETAIPGIRLDIRYATENNFTGTAIYTSPRAFLRKPAADSLLKVQQDLNREGLGLVIYDAYRPYAGTLYFYEVYPDTVFVAVPSRGSVHNRGCAVDLALIDLATGEYLTMPTEFDSFTEQAAASYPDLLPEATANRQKLQQVMTRHGFDIYEGEWWHFNFGDRKQYRLLDIAFEELDPE